VSTSSSGPSSNGLQVGENGDTLRSRVEERGDGAQAAKEWEETQRSASAFPGRDIGNDVHDVENA